MKKSQRASETQNKINNIQRSITSIRKEITPIPTVSSIGSNPRAKPTAKSRWIRRSVRLTGDLSQGSVVVPYQDIGEALGGIGSEAYTVKVLGIKAWNITAYNVNSNSITVTMSAAALLGGNTGVVGEDFGCATRLPGIKINIPDLLAASIVTTSASTLCTITTPFASGTSTQHYCLDVDLMVQM